MIKDSCACKCNVWDIKICSRWKSQNVMFDANYILIRNVIKTRVTNYTTKYDLHLLHCLWATDKISSSCSWSFSRAHSIDIMHFAKTIRSSYDFYLFSSCKIVVFLLLINTLNGMKNTLTKNAIFHLTKYTEHFN